MYKTIIIIIRRPIIIGLSNCPAISPQRRTSHTHVQMRIGFSSSLEIMGGAREGLAGAPAPPRKTIAPP